VGSFCPFLPRQVHLPLCVRTSATPLVVDGHEKSREYGGERDLQEILAPQAPQK
jgi:hypothetical protein